MKISGYISRIIIAICSVIFIFYIYYNQRETFISGQLSPGMYPISETMPLKHDYPFIGKNETSNNSAENVWWYYPVLPLASFKQVTNNLRYRRNPDNGTCVRSDFCGALYHDIENKTNIVKPLPEVKEGDGARVGYYRSEPNLLFFSESTNDNILY